MVGALFALQFRAGPSVPRDAAAPPASNGRVWPGHIETAPRWVVPPSDHIHATLCREFRREVWTPSEAVSDALLQSAFPPAARATVLATRHCQPDGCTQQLTGEALRAISRAQRGELSRALGAWAANTFYAMPMHRPEGRPPFAETPGLPADAREALRSVTWDDAGGESVSAPRAICDAGLPDASLLAALRALWSIPSVNLTVRVDHPDELDGIARYWSWGRDPATVSAQLRTRLPAGSGGVSVNDLLPTRVASRVFTYAPVEGDHHNCLNAVLCDDESCPEVLDGPEAEARLTRLFTRVGSIDDLRAGDVVVWRDEGGAIAHGAAWLAGRWLFTKNGVSFLRPWHVAPFDAIQRSYRHATRVEYWQRR